MSDQTPDPTTWSDNQIDNLLDRLAERAEQRDDLDLPGSGASRRGVLAGLLGLGGAAAGAGVASAIGDSESYGASTGVVGTDPEPLNEANVQDLHAQDAQIDSLLETERILSQGRITTRDSGDKALRSVGNGFVGAAIEAYRDSSSDKAILNFYGARGTESSPAAIQNNDRIGSLLARGYDGSGFYITSNIITRATETFSGTAAGSEVVIKTTADGTRSKSDAVIMDVDTGITVASAGSASQPAVEIGNAGAGLFVNGSGEVVVVDESGNTRTIS